MGRYLAAVVLVGGAVFLGGLFGARSVRQQAALAQSHVPLLSNYQPVSIPATAAASARKNPSRDRSIGSSDATSDASVPPATANRFDRGRLSEEFDGEIFGSAPAAQVAVADADLAPPAPTQIPQDAQSLSLRDAVEPPGNPGPELDDFSPPVPRLLTQPRVNESLFPDSQLDLKQTGTLAPPAPFVAAPSHDDPFGTVPSTPTTQAARVTLIRTPDHQIRIVAESKSVGEAPQPLAAGAIAITAEEFTLTPPTEPGTGNQLSCLGRIEISGQHFRAQGTKLSVKNTSLVLEGSPGQPASIARLPAATTNSNETTTDDSKFRVTAGRISFSLSLDTIKVSDTVSIVPEGTAESTPAAPPVPSPVEEIPAKTSTPPDSKSGRVQSQIPKPILPSAYYFSDDVQYFPFGSEFRLMLQVEALKAYKLKQQGKDARDAAFRIESATPFDAPSEAPGILPTGTIEIGPVTETKTSTPPK